MDSSLNSTRLQKTEAEILSLLDVLSDKVDLERKLGVDYVQLAPIDIHNERKTDETEFKNKLLLDGTAPGPKAVDTGFATK